MTDGLAPAVVHPSSAPSTSLSPRTASLALYAAVVTMVSSMVAISLFFGGAGAFWGPVNDLLVVATVLLLLPALIVVRGLARGYVGSWFTGLTVAAVIGVLVIAAGQLALVAGLITLDTSFLTGGLGVLPVIAWLGSTALLGLRTPVLERATGWWAVAFMAVVVATFVVVPTLALDMPTMTAVLGVPFMVTLFGWLVSLARDLARTRLDR